ncbi:MAG: hypothetical protein FJ288_09075 [Planctomycetes bacterium]|nr:hypothetical protein [Planctomycetota bacterium]
MEKHFLEGKMEGKPEFRAEPWYNPYGDCIEYQVADEAFVAERIDELLTIYRSAIDNRPVGFQIKGVQAIIRRFGWDGLVVASEAGAGQVRSISIVALLLAAYEEGPKTLGRRRAYAAVMESPPKQHTIPADELVPA